MVKFQFKGLLAPVFTPFTTDKKLVDFDVIEKYGLYLKQKGIHGILVNGAVGEGTTLRIDERKRLAEEWLRVSRKHGMIMMLAIGGVGVADVYDLAEHAEKIGVDSIVLLPDLFYKPRVEEDLVDYIKDVVKYAPTRPLYYYHIPEFTYVKLNILRLNELIQRSVTNYTGIYYRHTNLEIAQDLLKEGVNIILATDTILTGVLVLGFDAISSVALNLFPENVIEIHDLVLNGKYREAREINEKLYRHIKDVLHSPTADWIEVMKIELNKMTEFKIGQLRKPRLTYNVNRML